MSHIIAELRNELVDAVNLARQRHADDRGDEDRVFALAKAELRLAALDELLRKVS